MIVNILLEFFLFYYSKLGPPRPLHPSTDGRIVLRVNVRNANDVFRTFTRDMIQTSVNQGGRGMVGMGVFSRWTKLDKWGVSKKLCFWSVVLDG